jgi:hypothetical protein
MDPANMGPLHSVSLFSMLATLCSDGIAAHDSALVAPEDKGAEFSGIAGIFEICGNWARKVSTPAIPTNTDVPMITLTGLLDPITPPDKARRIAAAIGPGVRQFEFASIGHAAVPSSACALAITKLFFTNPSQPLRPDCLAADPPIQFAPPPDEAGGAVR